MRHPATEAIYAYWNELRGGRPAPRRLEIQPSRISPLLPDTFILERIGRSAFRFRLAGSRVSARFGTSLREQDFMACWTEADRGLLEPHLMSIIDCRRIGLFTGEAPSDASGKHDCGHPVRREFELILLPLFHTGYEIDRLLGHLAFHEDPAATYADRISRLRLLAAESVWPEGEENYASSWHERQLPLSPHVRTARIVRQGHRQFRVYEGGLAAVRRGSAETHTR
ncbi:PAS domain-containing protein [Hyphomicrobium sp.]|uniref:PAS domain-containing protein n=1 Tax=Hyphomicrobium sp. TaxID=82 RepID=UPI002FDEDE76